MYVYMYTHIYIPTYMVYIYTYIHIYIYTYICIHTDIYGLSAERGDRTRNNYDCQNFQQDFTGVPVHIKHVFSGVPKF